MPDYGSYCPVALASDAVADRWTPLILRELITGNTRFNDIARGMPGISRSLLVQRLRHLERKGIIEVRPLPHGRGSEYRLTPAGRDLEPVLMALGRWSVQWLYHRMDPATVSAETLMWWMHRRMDPSQLPARRHLVLFEHTSPEPRHIWLHIDHEEVSVCLVDPGFEVDAIVRCTTPALAQVFSGQRTWQDAVDSRDIELKGNTTVLRALPRWFVWSPWAPDVRARAHGTLPSERSWRT